MATSNLYLNHDNISNSNNGKKFLFIILICAMVLPLIYGAHAVEKHGKDAEAVRQAMEEQGAIEIWQKPDGRLVNVCKVGEQFGIQITAGNNEVTCFIKEKMTKLEQVITYLKNMGAKPYIGH